LEAQERAPRSDRQRARIRAGERFTDLSLAGGSSKDIALQPVSVQGYAHANVVTGATESPLCQQSRRCDVAKRSFGGGDRDLSKVRATLSREAARGRRFKSLPNPDSGNQVPQKVR
jgi:hypothetical protein